MRASVLQTQLLRFILTSFSENQNNDFATFFPIVYWRSGDLIFTQKNLMISNDSALLKSFQKESETSRKVRCLWLQLIELSLRHFWRRILRFFLVLEKNFVMSSRSMFFLRDSYSLYYLYLCACVSGCVCVRALLE